MWEEMRFELYKSWTYDNYITYYKYYFVENNEYMRLYKNIII